MVVVYSLPHCVQCNATYKKLDQLGVEYLSVDLTTEPSIAYDLREAGYAQAPIVKAPDGTLFSGYRPDLLEAIARELPES